MRYEIQRGYEPGKYRSYFHADNYRQALVVYRRLQVGVGEKKRLLDHQRDRKVIKRDIPRQYKERP